MRPACPVLALLLLVFSTEAITQVALPRSSLLISGRGGFMPGFVDMGRSFLIRKRSYRPFDEEKRGTRWVATVPRSGLMIGGRGWMPGFRSSSSMWDASF